MIRRTVTISNHRDSLALDEDAAKLLAQLIVIGWRTSFNVQTAIEMMGADEALEASHHLDMVINLLHGLVADSSKMKAEGDPA